MFTGIIEDLATIEAIEKQGGNIRFTLSCPFVNELQIDQSVAHDGVCLTVVELENGTYAVDAIQETLDKTNLKSWKTGGIVNVERSVTMNKRLDGHIVQGHVDTVLQCVSVGEEDGSWRFTFSYSKEVATLLISKGSICINGISLTIADLQEDTFSVAIIPYTYEYTNLSKVKAGDFVNIEFDMVGKYINRIAQVNS